MVYGKRFLSNKSEKNNQFLFNFIYLHLYFLFYHYYHSGWSHQSHCFPISLAVPAIGGLCQVTPQTVSVYLTPGSWRVLFFSMKAKRTKKTMSRSYVRLSIVFQSGRKNLRAVTTPRPPGYIRLFKISLLLCQQNFFCLLY